MPKIEISFIVRRNLSPLDVFREPTIIGTLLWVALVTHPIWPHRLAVRTRPFQGRGTGSIPVGVIFLKNGRNATCSQANH